MSTPPNYPHKDLITSLETYYKTLTHLNVFAPTSLILPPSTGHILSTTLLQSTGLSPASINLATYLPCLNGPELLEFNHDIAPFTQPVKYIDEDDFEWSRDPQYLGRPEIRGRDLLLSWPGAEGVALVYSTETGRIWVWRPSDEEEGDDDDDEDGEEEGNEQTEGERYTHLPSCSPSELFHEWTQNLISLSWLPYRGTFVTTHRPTASSPTATPPPTSPPTNKLTKLRNKRTSLINTLKTVYIACGWDAKAQGPDKAARNFDLERFVKEKQDWENVNGQEIQRLDAEIEEVEFADQEDHDEE